MFVRGLIPHVLTHRLRAQPSQRPAELQRLRAAVVPFFPGSPPVTSPIPPPYPVQSCVCEKITRVLQHGACPGSPGQMPTPAFAAQVLLVLIKVDGGSYSSSVGWERPGLLQSCTVSSWKLRMGEPEISPRFTACCLTLA